MSLFRAVKWQRVLATQLRHQPDGVALVGFSSDFEALAKASHRSFCMVQFCQKEKEVHWHQGGVTVVRGRPREIVVWLAAADQALRLPRDIRNCVISDQDPMELLADLTALLTVSEREGSWRLDERAGAAGVFRWRWTRGDDFGTNMGVHVVRRYIPRRSHFDGHVLDNRAAINHRFPDDFLTLGGRCFERGIFSGGTLEFKLSLPRMRRIRRAYLRVIWPPFHGRGLIASKRSGESRVGMRLGKFGRGREAKWLAECLCTTLGHYGRYHPQAFNKEDLILVVSRPSKVNVRNLQLLLDITPNACLDVYRLSLHLFGQPAVT